MEFEILNEIMTGTVAQLFTVNRSSHLKFFKNSSQLNESKIDIPIGRGSTSNLLLDANTNNYASTGNGNQTQSLNGTVPSSLSQQEWVNTSGKKFLEDAKDRLQIDTKQYLYRGAQLSQLTYEELNKIKRNVKGELKKYDQLFSSLFCKQPAKTDKEPLRPLYMYYKKLKQLIQNALNRLRQGGNQGNNTSSDRSSINNGVISNSKIQPQDQQIAQNTGGQSGATGSRAHSASSAQSKISYNLSSAGGNSTLGSRDNSLSGPMGDLTNVNQQFQQQQQQQQRAGSAGTHQINQMQLNIVNQQQPDIQQQHQQRQASLTLQDLASGVTMGQTQQPTLKKSADNVLQQNNNKYNQQQQQPQKQMTTAQDQSTKGGLGQRKNSTGTSQHTTSNSIGGQMMEKDNQGRLMGVRGSVELKSINSVGGLQNMMGGNNNNNQGNTANNGGFMYQQSKHQTMGQKQSTQQQQQQQQQNYKDNINQQPTGGYQQQYSKADMNNVRKSAQAATLGSLLDNNLNYEQQQQNMYQQRQHSQQYQQSLKSGVSQSQQFKQGSMQQYQQFDPRSQQQQQYMMQQQQQPSQQINFYHQPQQQQQNDSRKENINFYDNNIGLIEGKNMSSNPTQQQPMGALSNNLIGNNQVNNNLKGKEQQKRPQSANVGSQQQQQQQMLCQQQQQQQNQRARQQMQQQQQIQDLAKQIDEFKKERGILRQTLDTFRRDFEKTNARKIKFKKDIKAVEDEFKRYKDLKDDIHKLEKQLAILTGNSSNGGNSQQQQISIGGSGLRQ